MVSEIASIETVTDAPVLTARAWSPQQQAIFGWFQDCRGHLIVEAGPGSGKTTVIVEGITHAPEARIVVCAFNKRIQEELAARLTNPAAEAKTFHGIGFAIARQFWPGVSVARDRVRVTSLVNAVCDASVPGPIQRLVGTLLTLAREMAPHATEVGQLTDLAVAFDCEPSEEWEAAGWDLDAIEARVLDAMVLAAETMPADGIDFADMIYVPVRNRWAAPRYDLVVVDEMQDMSRAQLDLVQGVNRGRFVGVGDANQSLYAFRGCETRGMARMREELSAISLGLTVSYRCARAIVREAQAIVPTIEWAPGAIEGSVQSVATIEAMCRQVGPQDFVLSRTNAPLVKVAMALIRAGKPVRIQGRDIGQGLITLARTLMRGDAAVRVEAFLERVVQWERREVLRAVKADRGDRVQGICDKGETLRVLAEGVDQPSEVETRLTHLFSDTGLASAVVCSSIHRAKGLEARRVFLLRPTLYPRLPKGVTQTPEQAQQERNAHFVAITRAQETLVYVEEK